MAVPIIMPKLGMVMSEGTVARWTKPAGEVVQAGEVIAEIETEKINYDLEATEDGVLHQVAAAGDLVPVDGVVGYLLAEGEEAPQPEEAAPAPVAPAAAPERAARRPRPSDGGAVRSTPGARKVAVQLGVDISEVTPSGPGGRVVEDDVRAFAEGQGAEAPAATRLPEPAQVFPLEGIRKTIADHMRQSIAATAQLSFFLEVDVTEAQRLRREASGSNDATVTLANVVAKACAQTLKRQPEHNSVLADGKVMQFDEINIGIAVALKEGLIVPVLKQVDTKSIIEIAKETTALAEKARDGALLPDEVAGGTFTISVLGTVDGFTPILNSGQSAILGVGRSIEKPVVSGGEVVVREMATVSLTVDHQVIDGAVAAGFLRRFQQTVERPGALFK